MGVASKTLVPLEEYLHTSYRPDCDYVDGELVERNVGERDHSICQGLIYAWLLTRREQLGIYPLIELRTQVRKSRFRVPDVCVFLGGPPTEQIPVQPPFLAIEILSPEDRLTEMLIRVDDYLSFGVPNIRMVDPGARRGFVCTSAGTLEVKDLILRTTNPEIVLPLQEIFAALN
jgi:Uma2 family endonuclease